MFLGCPAIVVFTLLRAPQLSRGLFKKFLPKRQVKLREVNPLLWLLTFLGTSCALALRGTEIGFAMALVCVFILLLFGFSFLAPSIGFLYQFGILMRAGIADALQQRDTLA